MKAEFYHELRKLDKQSELRPRELMLAIQEIVRTRPNEYDKNKHVEQSHQLSGRTDKDNA